jgi:hypothetical protein
MPPSSPLNPSQDARLALIREPAAASEPTISPGDLISPGETTEDICAASHGPAITLDPGHNCAGPDPWLTCSGSKYQSGTNGDTSSPPANIPRIPPEEIEPYNDAILPHEQARVFQECDVEPLDPEVREINKAMDAIENVDDVFPRPKDPWMAVERKSQRRKNKRNDAHPSRESRKW